MQCMQRSYPLLWLQEGLTLLSRASSRGRTDLVQLFLDHGADVDLPDDVSSYVLTAHVHSSYMSNSWSHDLVHAAIHTG